jgi:hypothetical protein
MFNSRWIFLVSLLLSSAIPLWAHDERIPPAAASCDEGVAAGTKGSPCKKQLPKKQIEEARSAYTRGLKLEERTEYGEALAEFDRASRLIPADSKFLAAREMAKSQLVFQHTQRGDALLSEGQRDAAAAEFRLALELEPDNNYLANHWAEAQRERSANSRLIFAAGDSEEIASGQVQVRPNSMRATVHFQGEVRELFKELGAAYGMDVALDESVQSRVVRFDVDDIDFLTAIALACRVSKNMWTPLGSHQVLVAANTSENHKQFDEMFLATITVPGSATPAESQELMSLLRNICDLQKISSVQTGILELRGPEPALTACTKLMRQLDTGRPQVVLRVEVYRIDHTFTREIGMHVPDTFNMYNLASVESAVSAGQSLSTLEQEVASGSMSGNSALTALLTQLETQTGIFSSPLATFGNGLTYSGISLDHLSATLSLNESWSQSLSQMILRSSQGKEATLHIGERYPILNASYSTITASIASGASSTAISSLQGTQSSVSATPSVSYEDLGLTMKVTPAVHSDGVVSLKIGLKLRALTGSSSNGIPLISNEEYQGSALLQDGEAIVIAGEITTNDTLALSGIPGISYMAGLGSVLDDHSASKDKDELLIIVTPHVTTPDRDVTKRIWVTDSTGLR